MSIRTFALLHRSCHLLTLTCSISTNDARVGWFADIDKNGNYQVVFFGFSWYQITPDCFYRLFYDQCFWSQMVLYPLLHFGNSCQPFLRSAELYEINLEEFFARRCRSARKRINLLCTLGCDFFDKWYSIFPLFGSRLRLQISGM